MVLSTTETKARSKHGRRTECTFLHRRHVDAQKVHEKMLSATSNQRNANQHHNEVSLHQVRPIIIKTINTRQGVKKRSSSYPAGENVNWYSHYGEQHGGFLKN